MKHVEAQRHFPPVLPTHSHPSACMHRDKQVTWSSVFPAPGPIPHLHSLNTRANTFMCPQSILRCELMFLPPLYVFVCE